MIREANLSDEQSIIELGKFVNKNYEKLFDLSTILNSDYSKLLVIEENKNIKGFIHYNNLIDNIDIINLVVDPIERQKGYGNSLLNYIISNAKKEIKTITLEVSSNNEAAKKLYLKNNFEIVNIIKNYYKGEDGLLMKRWIK